MFDLRNLLASGAAADLLSSAYNITITAMESTEYITASELSDYVYCKRGWWLRKQKLLPVTDAMLGGTEGHNSLFLLVQSLRLRRFIAWVFLLVGAIIMVSIILSQLWQL